MRLPRISVVVPVLNGERTIGDCLESLLVLDYPRSLLDIIVVDNGSADGTRRAVARYADAVRIVSEPRRGPASARNAGIAHARGEIVAFTDADCVVDRDWLCRLIPPLADPQVGIVGGLMLARDRSHPIEQYGEEIHDHYLSMTRFKPPYAITMNWASRRTVLERVGLFDETLRRCEDVDLAYRIVQAGYTLVFAPAAVVRHAYDRTLPRLFATGFAHGLYAVQAVKKHHAWVRALGHRRVNRRSYLALAGHAADWVMGRNRSRAACDLVFNSGKKIGKLCGTIRFGYVEL
jgi:GT2 family glycosyltransferase